MRLERLIIQPLMGQYVSGSIGVNTVAIHVDYILDIDQLPTECIEDCSRPGPVDEAVTYWRDKLGLTVDRDRTIRCFTGYGSWDPEELAATEDDTLANRVLWLACCTFNEWDGNEDGNSESGSCQFVLE